MYTEVKAEDLLLFSFVSFSLMLAFRIPLSLSM